MMVIENWLHQQRRKLKTPRFTNRRWNLFLEWSTSIILQNCLSSTDLSQELRLGLEPLSLAIQTITMLDIGEQKIEITLVWMLPKVQVKQLLSLRMPKKLLLVDKWEVGITKVLRKSQTSSVRFTLNHMTLKSKLMYRDHGFTSRILVFVQSMMALQERRKCRCTTMLIPCVLERVSMPQRNSLMKSEPSVEFVAM